MIRVAIHVSRARWRQALAACAVALLVASPAWATSFLLTPVVTEGDSAGHIGRVTSIDNLAVNDAGLWLVEVDTDFANADLDGALLRGGAVQLRENDPLPAPPGARLDTFDSINLNNSGDSGWNFFLSGTSGINDDSGIYRNTTLVLQESNVSTSPAFSPGTRYIGFFDAKINDLDKTLVVASIEDTAIATTVDRALVVLDHPGGVLLSETVLAKEADLLPGQTQTVADFGTGPHQSAFNDGGHVLFFADLNGDTARDGTIYLDGTLLAQEGSPSPVAGRNYELLSSRALALNSNGDWVFKANLDGATTDDELIVHNGAVLVREGGSLPVIGSFHFTAFGTGPVEIDDLGNVLWFGDWDDPDLTKDTALFLNDEIVAYENQSLGGFVIDEIASGEDAFKISDNGRWILFEATFVGGINVAILVEVDRPVPALEMSLAAASVAGGVELRWNLRADRAPEAISVRRGRDGAEEEVVASWTGAATRLAGTWTDREVAAGTRYSYRLLAQFEGSLLASEPVDVTFGAPVVAATRLLPATPNPFNPSTRLRFQLARPGEARLAIFDVGGRLVRRFAPQSLPAGEHVVFWDGRDDRQRVLPSGTYLVDLRAGSVASRQRVTLVR
jgi:hypothetical protein